MRKTNFLENGVCEIRIAEVTIDELALHKVLIVQIAIFKIAAFENTIFVFSFWETCLGIVFIFESLVCCEISHVFVFARHEATCLFRVSKLLIASSLSTILDDFEISFAPRKGVLI